MNRHLSPDWIIIAVVLMLAHLPQVACAQSALTTAALDSAMTLAFYPSSRKVEVRVRDTSHSYKDSIRCRAVVIGPNGRIIAKRDFTLVNKTTSVLIDLPKLKEGKYELDLTLLGSNISVKRSFKYRSFPWLSNALGENDVIYEPYEPIRVNDNVVSVVLRDYTMNGFGLWNSVRSQGKEILAGPVVLRLVTAKGEGQWTFEKGRWTHVADTTAIYEAKAKSDAVVVRAKSTLEYDGCMKVQMTLMSGRKPEVINRLWLEIPVKDSEAPLFHYCAFESMRRNYAGRTPRGGKIVWLNQPYDTDPPRWPRGALPPIWKVEPGPDDGVLWTCRDIRPWKHAITTDFVPYIWVGGGERGLAFFGANDKGYIVDGDGTMQKLVRKNGVLYLQVDLINKPIRLQQSTNVTFGLQASPTRPMPDHWRVRQKITPAMPGPVFVWGGYICANKYPEGNNWRVVDEICKIRETGNIDTSIFVTLDRNRAEPWKKPWGGTGAPGFDKWFARDMWFFINQAKRLHDSSDWKKITAEGIYTDDVAKMLADASWMAYTEEHASDVTEPEWEIFQDEWRAEWPWTKPRNVITGQQQPENNFESGHQSFVESYLDFCLYYHSMWFKRGIGVYFDNTMPYTMYNPLLSDAYFDASGNLQPACSIWEQREYYKRVWQLMNQLQRKGVPHPLAFAQHITNTRLLPWNTWNSTSLDIEWDWYRDTTVVQTRTANGRRRRPLRLPVPADLLLAEAVGRQTGSMGDSHFGILGQFNSNSSVPQTYPTSEWGMRAVHEFKSRGSQELDEALWKFGYGTDRTEVVNYWADDPPVSLSDPDVNKWLLVKRESDKSVMLIVQTWSKSDTEVVVTLDFRRMGFKPQNKGWDVVSGSYFNFGEQVMRLNVPGPYGTRVLILGATQEHER